MISVICRLFPTLYSVTPLLALTAHFSLATTLCIRVDHSLSALIHAYIEVASRYAFTVFYIQRWK